MPATLATAASVGAPLVRLEHACGPFATAVQIARRTLLKFVRSPQLIVVGTLQGLVFLLVFRYAFGGAIHAGSGSYVDYLIPGFVVASVLFGGAAAGVAEDAAEGLFDRLRSLPVSRTGILAGRAVADTLLVLWGIAVSIAAGYLVGFRAHGSATDILAALGLVVLYAHAWTWAFIALGLLAGSAQAAQGFALLFVPVSFLASTYVPVATLPGVLETFARHQPLTPMVDAVRHLALGQSTGDAIPVSLGWTAGLVVVFATISVIRFQRA